LAAAIGTAVLVAVLYAVLTPLAIGDAFEPDLLMMGLTLGLTWNLLDHLVIFCMGFRRWRSSSARSSGCRDFAAGTPSCLPCSR